MASPSGKMLSLSGCSADGVNNHPSEDEATDTHKDISHTKNPNFTQIEKMADKASVR